MNAMELTTRIHLGQHSAEQAARPPLSHHPEAVSLDHIQYTETKTVAVSRDFLRRRRIIAGYEPCPFVDAYKVLRTRALRKMREQGWTTLAVTSPGAACGKSLTAINLGLSMALDVNQTVLLVDADLRTPALHRHFGIEPEYGLCDYLVDNVPLQKTLINAKGIRRFVMLPGKRALLDSSERLSSPKMERLVEELKHRYPSRVVLFDLPHLATADALAVAPYVDAVLMVVEEGKTTRSELTEALSLFNGMNILGVVLNKADTRMAEYAGPFAVGL
jgi:protein-tyrosine kinase